MHLHLGHLATAVVEVGMVAYDREGGSLLGGYVLRQSVSMNDLPAVDDEAGSARLLAKLHHLVRSDPCLLPFGPQLIEIVFHLDEVLSGHCRQLPDHARPVRPLFEGLLNEVLWVYDV